MEGEEFHHLVRVLRRQVGEEVIAIFPTQGRQYLTTLTELNPTQATLKVKKQILEALELGHPAIHLVLGILQPRLLDFVIEKTIELGVSSLQLFRGEKSKVSELSESRSERLTRLAAAAAKQSGTAQIPEICFHASLEAALLRAQPTETSALANRFLCSIREDSFEELAQVLLQSRRSEGTDNTQFLQKSSASVFQPAGPITPLQRPQQNDETYLVVGPESGLTAAEEALAISWGFRPVSLGPTILRAETAAIVVVALARALLR